MSSYLEACCKGWHWAPAVVAAAALWVDSSCPEQPVGGYRAAVAHGPGSIKRRKGRRKRKRRRKGEEKDEEKGETEKEKEENEEVEEEKEEEEKDEEEEK